MKESQKQSLGSPQQSEADSLVSQVPLDQMDNFAKVMIEILQESKEQTKQT